MSSTGSAGTLPLVRLRLLGGVDLKNAAGEDLRTVLAQPKRLMLLAYLALSGPERYARRDNLIALFWPESDDDAARHSLRTSLHFLRQSLGEGVLSGRGQEEVRVEAAGLWCDAITFEQALREGRLEDALTLYRGDLLDGFFVADASQELDSWIDQERKRLKSAAAKAAFALAERAHAEGNSGLTRHWASRCLELAPYDEAVVRRLMSLLKALGERAGALQLYEQFASRLKRDLDLEPSVESQALLAGIRVPEARQIAQPVTLDETRLTRAEPLTRRRRFATAFVIGPALLVIAIAFFATARLRRASAVPILAVGTIDSRLGRDSDSTDPSGVLRDLLATDLARVEGLRVVSEARLIELLGLAGAREETRAARTDAARRAGAQELLEGVIYRRGQNQLRLDLQRVDLASGVLRGSLSAEASDLFALADSATAAIGRLYKLQPPVDPLAQVTTTSLVARRFYEEGLRAYHRAEPTLALRYFRSALAEDSSFAMAAYYAAQMASWQEPSAATGFAAQARRAAAHLPDRERLIVRAGWAQFANDPSLLVVAESLATRYPAEPDGEYAWGRALLWSGDLGAAIAHLERAVTMDSLGFAGRTPQCRACDALEAIAEAQTASGDLRAAESTLRAWLARQPQSPQAWNSLTRFLERTSRPVEAMSAQRRLMELVPASSSSWDWLRVRLAIRAGQFREADRLIAALRDVPGASQGDALWWIVISLRNQGRLREALDSARRYRRFQESSHEPEAALAEAQVLFEDAHFSEAAQLFEQVAAEAIRPLRTEIDLGSFGPQARRGSWRLTHAAGAWAAAGDVARAARLADSVERLGARSAFGRDQRLHYYVRGLLARLRGRDSEAESLLRRAQYAVVGGFSRINLELAKLLIDRGRPVEAVDLLRAALEGDLDGSNYYVTHRALHQEMARAFRAAGMPDSAMTHARWGTPEVLIAR